jgi:RNA polymerase sigma-70 factor (ECF subfamily)
LREALLAHAGPAAPALAAVEDLEGLLQRHLKTARTAWPDVRLAAEDFVRHLGERVAREREPAKALAEVCAADLFLACACAHAEARALAHFDACLTREVRTALRASTTPPQVAEEVLGILRERLLVAPAGERPRVATYSGRGSLSSWVRVAAVRAALNLQAQQREGVAREDASSSSGERPLPAPRGADPELSFLKRHYRADFKAALEAAITSLAPEQRALLRQHFLEGLSIDELGRRHGVHRSTAARWVVRGREALLDGMRAQLMRRLAVSAPELDSLMNLMSSQLDVSLGGLLRSSGD